jgi:CRP-like cAMP-binding protein
MSGGRVSVIDADRGLARTLTQDRVAAARAPSTAAMMALGVGAWEAPADAARAKGGYGLLVLDGLFVRLVGLGGRFGAELLGRGDLLRPWEGDGEPGGTLSFDSAWRVLTPARLAVLDPAWAARMAAFPEVGPELTGRAIGRVRRAAALMSIVQLPRLEDRLWLLFWELADRHGHVHPDGVHIDLPLTHELISHLAAARRPSVSGALTRLTEAGKLRRSGRSWVLCGDPPEPRSRGWAAAPAGSQR